MSAFKGTPGPWSVSKRHPRRVTAKGVMVSTAVLRNQGGGGSLKVTKDRDEAEANARLIAAAPELLEACEKVIDAIRGGETETEEAIGAVLEAIAKATGGEA